MIARRTLFLLVLLVLALHVLVLGGASAYTLRAGSAAPRPAVFETRSIALPPPPAAVPAPAARPAVARAAPGSGTPRPSQRRTRAAERPPAIDLPVPEPAPWTAPSAAELLALGASMDAPAPPAAAASSAAAAPPTPAVQVAAAMGPRPAASAPATPELPPAASAPVRLPPPARLEFDVVGRAKGLNYHASAELLWQHDGASYRAHQEIRVLFLGSRAQDSVGSITAHGLQPRRFGDRSRSERAAHFDFAAGRVTFSANTPAAPIEAGAQDRLSVFLQLGGMLAAAPERYGPGTQIAMTTVSARAADVWTFTVEGEQMLELPIGTLAAVPLQRLPRREYDQKAQVWLAPSLGYLPVRIRLTEANGDFAELNLQSREAP